MIPRSTPWARRTKLLDPPSTPMPVITEVIPAHLWQSCDPSPEMLKELRPDNIVDCRWFDDNSVKLPEDMGRLSSTADAVTTLVRSGNKVLVHCLAGINRSSLLVCLVLMRIHPDWSGAQCVRFLEAKRPDILSNKLYRSYLWSLNEITVANLETP